MLAAVFGLIGVIVGGLLGTGGLWLIEGRRERSEQKKRRARKLEELVAAIYEHKHWLDVVENQRVFGSTAPKPMSPFAKVEAIATVHFPQFLPKLSALEDAAKSYELWMFDASQKRSETGKADTTGHKEVYTAYAAKRSEALKVMRQYAQAEF